MSEEDQAYFVWVRGTKDPERQKWSDMPYSSDGYLDRRILAKHPITRAMFEDLTLDQLAKLYPAPCTYF